MTGILIWKWTSKIYHLEKSCKSDGTVFQFSLEDLLKKKLLTKTMPVQALFWTETKKSYSLKLVILKFWLFQQCAPIWDVFQFLIWEPSMDGYVFVIFCISKTTNARYSALFLLFLSRVRTTRWPFARGSLFLLFIRPISPRLLWNQARRAIVRIWEHWREQKGEKVK